MAGQIRDAAMRLCALPIRAQAHANTDRILSKRRPAAPISASSLTTQDSSTRPFGTLVEHDRLAHATPRQDDSDLSRITVGPPVWGRRVGDTACRPTNAAELLYRIAHTPTPKRCELRALPRGGSWPGAWPSWSFAAPPPCTTTEDAEDAEDRSSYDNNPISKILGRILGLLNPQSLLQNRTKIRTSILRTSCPLSHLSHSSR